MEKLIGVAAALSVSIFLPGGLQAGNHRADTDDAHYEYATVTGVKPIVRIVQISTPREVCWDEQVRRTAYSGGQRNRSHTPTVVGGILGGVVGNQFGGGRGRTAMTVAGTLLGASVGRDAGYRRRVRHQRAAHGDYSTERRCEIEDVLHEEERVEGYRVTYAYQGKTYVSRTDEDPGRKIRIRVQVNPVDYY